MAEAGAITERVMDTSTVSEPPPDKSRRCRLVAVTVLGLVVLSSLLSVNTFPFVTNDGLVYIGHSRDLIGGGWVVEGFRQVGYPVFLAVVRGLADLVSAEPLLSTALLQRLLLVCAGILAFRTWKWWSVPLLVFLFAPESIAYTNFLLTEALGLSIAVLLVFPTVRFLSEVRGTPYPDQGRGLLILGGLATLGALILFSLRFTFAVFGAIPLVIGLAGWRTAHRKLGIGLLATYLTLAGAFTLLVTLENRVEFGMATPSVGSGLSRYYYAWVHVFREMPENRTDPELSEFYDDGEVHDLNRQLTSQGVPSAEREEVFDAEATALVQAAGISPLGSKLESMAWALAGGRLHDLAGGVFGAVHSTRGDVDRWIYFNDIAASRGPEGFARAYNDGQLPQAVITDPIGIPPPVADSQNLATVLVPLSLVVLMVSLSRPALRWLGVAGLLVMVGMAIGIGWIHADNFRFLLVPSAFAMAAATALLPRLVSIRRMNPA